MQYSYLSHVVQMPFFPLFNNMFFFYVYDQITMDSHLPTLLLTMMRPVPTPWPAVLTPTSAAVPLHAQVPTLRHTCLHPRLPLTP